VKSKIFFDESKILHGIFKLQILIFIWRQDAIRSITDKFTKCNPNIPTSARERRAHVNSIASAKRLTCMPLLLKHLGVAVTGSKSGCYDPEEVFDV
jgi:hypothetical protein